MPRPHGRPIHGKKVKPLATAAPAPPPEPAGILAREAELAAGGIPRCPCCGEMDRVIRQLGLWFCDRCLGFLVALAPPPGRHAPDF